MHFKVRMIHFQMKNIWLAATVVHPTLTKQLQIATERLKCEPLYKGKMVCLTS